MGTLMGNAVHLIAFDIPYPANYGGVIVIYNQIRALHARGVGVILHCFQYGDRVPRSELAAYCQEVHYYLRPRSWFYQLSLMPFIMRTRMSSALLKRLRQDDHPILFEGMHTAGYIANRRLRGRLKVLRMHNVEWQYYDSLSNLAVDWRERMYYFVESIKLQRQEPSVVLHADALLCLSTHDQAYFSEIKAGTHYLPAFHPHERVDILSGKGGYVLFHGKLGVPENEHAALWLIREVFSKLDVPFVIAGMSPSERLSQVVARYGHIRLVENPDEEQMEQLIREAHINLLVTFQRAGVKLKLLNALFLGRHCIVNDDMISGTPLAPLCHVRNSAKAIQQTVEALINAPFEAHRIEERAALLDTHFSNAKNAERLIQLLHLDAAGM